jgi:hypothetical protein
MRLVLVPALFVVFAFAGCASRSPVAQPMPPPVAKPTTPIAKNNRFDMSQNGHRMSADDFDAWMKARGIRVAKGKPQSRAQVKRTPSAQTKPKPKP